MSMSISKHFNHHINYSKKIYYKTLDFENFRDKSENNIYEVSFYVTGLEQLEKMIALKD